MKVFFAGTPDFAVPSLEALARENDIDAVGVFSQPSRPSGRGQKIRPTPVAQAAQKLGLPLKEVRDINSSENLNFIARNKPDFLVVVAFGQKIGSELLHLPDKGAVNLHASLLPRYRGPNPIQRAILNGDCESGLSTMLMDEGWDTGPILMQKKLTITSGETLGTLHDRMAKEGAPLLVQSLKLLAAGNIKPREQKGPSSHAPKLKNEEMYLDWEKDSELLERQVRALNPFPVARTYYQGEEWKIWESRKVEGFHCLKPGQIKVGPERVFVQTGNGSLEILKLQRPGKKQLAVVEFLRGFPLEDGSSFGKEGEINA